MTGRRAAPRRCAGDGRDGHARHDRHRRGRARRGADALHRRAGGRRRRRAPSPKSTSPWIRSRARTWRHRPADALTCSRPPKTAQFLNAPDTYLEKIASGRWPPARSTSASRRRRTCGASPRPSGWASRTSTVVILDRAAARRPDRGGPQGGRAHPLDLETATWAARWLTARARGPVSTCCWASAARPRACWRRRRCAVSAARCRARLKPATTRSAARDADGHHDHERVFDIEDWRAATRSMFAATGVTDGELLEGRPVLRRRRRGPIRS